jgi:hypothetical protein
LANPVPSPKISFGVHNGSTDQSNAMDRLPRIGVLFRLVLSRLRDG